MDVELDPPVGPRVRQYCPPTEDLREGLNRAIADPRLTEGLNRSEWKLPREAERLLDAAG